MSEALDKACAARDAARGLLDSAEPDEQGRLKLTDLENYQRLIGAANLNARIAIAGALEELLVLHSA